MRKVIKAVQTGRNKWVKRTGWKLEKEEVIAVVIGGVILLDILIQVSRCL